MKRQPTLAIIGGGASGMAAALAAADGRVRVQLYESQSRLGRKLLATGNGRCNFSHMDFDVANYHGQHPAFVRDALARFDEADTLAFFEALGLVATTDERDRYYPASLQAQAVLDVLRLSLQERGVEVITDTRITGLTRAKNGHFVLQHGKGRSHADAVIIACGGEAAPKLGGSRDGYKLLQQMGHTLVATAPGIVQLEGEVQSLKAAAGLKRDCGLTLRSEGKMLAQDCGELLITAYGISGPPVLQCSGAAVRALERGERVEAVIDFFPDESASDLQAMLLARHAQLAQRDAAAFFVGLLPRLLAQCALKACGVRPQERLTQAQVRALAEKLHAWPVRITGSRGFAEAQVTLGGIDTADFDSATLGSWLVPRLYACGEVLDIDGDCGGYNLQWAWSSGRLAGSSALQDLLY